MEAWNDLGTSKIAAYVNGFDLYSKSATYPNNSFEIKISTLRMTPSGISINIISNSTVQIERIYFSFVVINSKSPAQIISFLNQTATTGESKYLISPNGIQASTSTGTTTPTDLTKYRSISGLSSFSIDNNAAIPRAYYVQTNLNTGEVSVNTSTYKFNYLTNNYLLLKTDDCAGCLGYNFFDSASNNCVSFCPTNSYIELGQCKYCAAGQHLSGNVCITCGAN